MKKKLLVALMLSAVMLSGCGNSNEEQNSDEITQSTEETQEQEKSDAELSQSEWMEQHANEMEDGYEVVEAINIDSGDTKLEYTSSERYTLESNRLSEYMNLIQFFILEYQIFIFWVFWFQY